MPIVGKMSDTCLPTPETVYKMNIETTFSPSGRLISAKSKNRYVMEILADDGYLDQWHIEQAHVFMMLRASWLSPVGYMTSKLSDELISFIERTGTTMPEIYDAISHQLQKRQIRIIEWSATTLAKEPYPFRNAVIGQICNHAFEAMLKIMDNIHKEHLRSNKDHV